MPLTYSTVCLSVHSIDHLYPEVERLYENIKCRVIFEANVPDELHASGVVGGVRDVDSIALESHSYKVWNADDERHDVDEDDRQPGATDAAPDCTVPRVPNEEVPVQQTSP